MAVSYILSVQSTIQLIARRIEQISSLFPENAIANTGRYIFPSLKQLKSKIDAIRELKLGFRSRYIISFIEKLDSEDELNATAAFSYEKKLSWLTSFLGIGPKVAHCIMLFSFADHDIVPVDTWIKRFYAEYCADNGRKFTEKFHPYSGVLQEYIFRWIRSDRGV